MDEIRLTKIGPVVDLSFVGEVHMENGKLIVGDTDVVRKVWAHYGGHRQMAEVHVSIHLLTSLTTEVSPSGDGVFSESSEP